MRARKEGKQSLINDITTFKSEKLCGLVMDGNKNNRLSQWVTAISWQYFVTRTTTVDQPMWTQHNSEEKLINKIDRDTA
mgnify:CR=1 FL=1